MLTAGKLVDDNLLAQSMFAPCPMLGVIKFNLRFRWDKWLNRCAFTVLLVQCQPPSDSESLQLIPRAADDGATDVDVVVDSRQTDETTWHQQMKT